MLAHQNSFVWTLCCFWRQYQNVQPRFPSIVHVRTPWILRDFFPTRNGVWKGHERALPLCLNNKFNVGNKSVSLISFKLKVVCVPGLYLTGSLLAGMHSCGLHVYDKREVCGSIRSGQSHGGLICLSCQPVLSLWEVSPWHHRQVISFVFSSLLFGKSK